MLVESDDHSFSRLPQVNVDLKKNVETIEVPQIGFSSSVRIIEDFDHVSEPFTRSIEQFSIDRSI